MPIYDISLTVSPTLPVWPGDPPVKMTQTESMAAGAQYNLTRLDISAHTGTHVDAPHHFLNDGRTVETLSLEVLTGPCYVVQLPDDVDEISAEVLERTSLPSGTIRILFGTRNSKLWARDEKNFQEDFVAISPDGAQWLVAHGIKLVGVDYLSVAPFSDSVPTHEILLRAGVIALEGLNLSQIPRGFYDLYCLPLKLAGADGAPARAILVG
ncbi:MAG: cyclase [Chloroflexi bacterium HGW-Chloroflexi-6]|nr:MAG: cyclase [Chloroflexi bacterium HGW-Chloroflexi-6]